MPEEILEIFKALADPSRLKIIGLLAQRPAAVEELAANLGLGASTVSHHLSRLSRAGLTTAHVDGYNNVYSLHLDALQDVAKRILSREQLAAFASDVDVDAFDRKVLATFVQPDGRIRTFPVQQKKYRVLLRHVVQAFEPGVRYAEADVNEILLRFNDDTARLRRSLVELGLMRREGGGGAYWRTESTENP
ncbi:MAG TPA: metalloregulator ArsR/SmtB family transcription factor [Longimicrobium sp.]|nr:metalloregulator ArsR/SmtB family transcription factor [Longimicrobium sp.]